MSDWLTIAAKTICDVIEKVGTALESAPFTHAALSRRAP